MAASGVFALIAVVLVVRGRQDQPGPVAGASLPPASPGAVNAGYVGSHWRLTAVTDGRGTTKIPASVDAWLELQADGELLASDDVNAIDGRYALTAAGFDVSDAISTAVGYDGNDPVRVAAITGIDGLTENPQPLPSTASGPLQIPPAHVTVVSADGIHLNVEAAGVRLSFVRTGPAGTPSAPLPAASSAANR